jgi:Flp pilus assembly protein TadB
VATPIQERWEEAQARQWALDIKEREADLHADKALLRLLVLVTIVALLIALVGVVLGNPLTALAGSGVLSTTATVYVSRRRVAARRRIRKE